MTYYPPEKWLKELLQLRDTMIQSLICAEMDVDESTYAVDHFFEVFAHDPEQYRRYPMGSDQPAQVDCRIVPCKFHGKKKPCTNISPAITLNPDGTFTCWSRKE